MDFLDSIESANSERKKGSSGADGAAGADGGEPQQRSSGEKSGSAKQIEAARNILGSVRPEKKALKGLNIFGKNKKKKNADKGEQSVKGMEMRALGSIVAPATKQAKDGGAKSPPAASQFDAARAAPAMDDVPADFDWSDSENEAVFKPKGKSIFKTLKKKGKKEQNEAENGDGENADKSPSQSPKKGKNNLFKKKNKKEKALANKFEASIKAEAEAKAAELKEELKVEEFKIEDFKLEEDKVDEPVVPAEPRVEEADEI